jgi:hypothetical protein
MTIATETGEFEIPDYAQAWLDGIVNEQGHNCRNCGTFRILEAREISACPLCGEDAYDIYETALNVEFLP